MKKKIFIGIIIFILIVVHIVFAQNDLPLKNLVYQNTNIPYIYPRSVWADTQDIQNLLEWMPNENEESGEQATNTNNQIPNYAKVERIIIHDTGCKVYLSNGLRNPNCNGVNDNSIAIIKNIFKFHSLDKGWGDIGYNYIIDRQGRIFEGRYGGNGTRGAHLYDNKTCRNFNVGSIGIVILGNYEKEQPPEVVYQSLARLIGWLSAANNLNPSEMNKTSLIWQNQKIQNKCDLNNGDFSAEYTGPVVIGHNDIEKTNTDPGVIDLDRVRKESATIAVNFKNYLYYSFDENLVYKLEDGYANEVGFLKDLKNNSIYRLAQISKEQIGLFPQKSQKDISIGSLLKSYTMTNIYQLGNDLKLHLIISPKLFEKFGFKWDDVKEISDRNLSIYSLGNPLIYPDGTLIKDKNNNIYLVEGFKKRKIISEDIFKKNGYKVEKVIDVSDEELKYYENGFDIDLANGTLIKSSGPTVYYIKDGKKKAIPSLALFYKYKFKWQNVKILSDTKLTNYPDDGILFWPDKSLVKKAGDNVVYYIKNAKLHRLVNQKIFLALGFKWKDIINLSADEFKYYTLGASITNLSDYKNIDKLDKKLAEEELLKTPLPKVVPSQIVITNQTSPINSLSTSTSSINSISTFLQNQPTIRIGIYKIPNGQTIKIISNKDYKVEFETGVIVKKLAGISATILYRKDGWAKIYSDDADAIFTILSYNNIPNWNKNINYNQFRGKIEIKYSSISKAVWIVNELPIEEYLWGLGEALNNDPFEYQKAFSIISRSYAMYHLSNGGKYKGEIFHLNNTSSDQIYKGYVFETNAPNLVQAVKSTTGLILKYKGNIVRAVYSSGAPVKTKSACEIWGGEFCDIEKYGYLIGGVESPTDAIYKNATCNSSNHCIGLMADGARYLAKSGKNYEEILKYYYQNTNIEKIY